MKEELLKRLFFHHPIDFDEQQDLIQILNFVKENDIVRSTETHVTASAIVFNADKSKVLLKKHKKTGQWQQPSGHIEDCDKLLIDAALRVAKEDSGKGDLEIVDDGKIFIVAVQKNRINADAHTHLDIWFALCSKTEELNTAEIQWLRWFSKQEFELLNKTQKDKSLRRVSKKWGNILKKNQK